MTLITVSHDSLPYIDVEPTQEERRQAEKMIRSELPSGYQHTLHPALPPLAESRFSEIMERELERVSRGLPMQGGIDMSRYEAPDTPTGDSDVDTWKRALRQAYTSTSYVAGRQQDLSLLEEYGKNAWLIGNAQLEDELAALEKELAVLKHATDSVNKARKAAQEDSRGEMGALDDAWKRGISKIIEVQVATDGLRRDILERRQAKAGVPLSNNSPGIT